MSCASGPQWSRGEDWVIIGDHAASRWDERTPAESVAPETAWKHGVRCLAAATHLQCEEVRYHPATDTILLRFGHWIDTVINVADAKDESLPAVLRSVREVADE